MPLTGACCVKVNDDRPIVSSERIARVGRVSTKLNVGKRGFRRGAFHVF